MALVVGNSSYRAVNMLPNADNDARLIATTLRALGFTLVGGDAQLDLDRTQLMAAVQDFGRSLAGAEVALFYYAGHGLQVQGVNWLVPVDANPSRPNDLHFQMVDADLVLRQMDGAGTRLNIVLLDACRNNPFAISGLRSMQAGLAEMRAPEGTLISYATQPGNVAVDGDGLDSPYSVALAAAMRQPGLDIFRVFNQVGLQVKRITGGAQQPWVSTSPIDGDFFFERSSSPSPPPVPDLAIPPAVQPPPPAQLSTKQPLQASVPPVTTPEPLHPVPPIEGQGASADAQAAIETAARDQTCTALQTRNTGQQVEIRGLAAAGPQWDSFVQRMSATPGVSLATPQIEMLPPFACDAIDALSHVVRRTQDELGGRMLAPARRDWIAGETVPLVLHGTFTDAVLLDLYRPDGTVVHLPAGRPARAKDGIHLSATLPTGALPGKQVVTAIAGGSAAGALASRPPIEPSATYLAALRTTLSSDELARADMVMVLLRPAPVRAPVQPARAASTAPPASRCGGILERAQIGDTLSDADRAILRSCH